MTLAKRMVHMSRNVASMRSKAHMLQSAKLEDAPRKGIFQIRSRSRDIDQKLTIFAQFGGPGFSSW